MKKQMIIAGLAARPVRTLVSVLAVALRSPLILVVVGLTTGISTETRRSATEGSVRTSVFQPPNSVAVPGNQQCQHAAIAGRTRLKKIDGVTAVAPVQTLVNSSSGLEIISTESILISSPRSAAVSSGMRAECFQAVDDVVVDDVYAWPRKSTSATPVELLNHKLRVAGIVEHGKGRAALHIAEDCAGIDGTGGSGIGLLREDQRSGAGERGYRAR